MKNADEVKDKLAKLTIRNLEVLSLVCDGYSYKEIGERLHITGRAAQYHMTTAYNRLDLYFIEDKYKRRAELYQVYCPVLKNLDADEWPPEREEVLSKEEPPDARVFALVKRDAEEGIIPMSKGEIIEGQIISIEPPPPPSLPPPPNGRRLVLSAVLGSVISTVLIVIAVVIYITWNNRRFTPSEQLELPAVTPVVQVVVLTVERVIVATAISIAETGTPAVQVVVQTIEVERVVTATPKPVTASPLPPPTGTPMPLTSAPTYTPYPTQTPWIIIATPIPTPVPTEPEQTPPGTVLSPGEWWKQNEMVLTLKDFYINVGSDCIGMIFRLQNESEHEIILTLNDHVFSAVDNLGRSWKFHALVRTFPDRGCPPYSGGGSSVWSILPGRGRDFGTGFIGHLADTQVEYVEVTVHEVSRITDAKWRMPIYH